MIRWRQALFDNKENNERATTGLSADSPHANALSPIMIRTIGRDGSTWLMSLIGTSDKVALEDNYPFEQRFLSYFMRIGFAMQGDKNFALPKGLIGSFPFDTKGYIEKTDFAEECVKSLWTTFSAHYKKTQQGASTPVYYLEKGSYQAKYHWFRDFSPKVICLLRDPRDHVLSVNSFNKKRGFLAFDWEQDDCLLSYSKKRKKLFRLMLTQAIEAMASNSELVVRYEDLLAEPEKEYKRLEDFLDIKIDIQKIKKIGSEHRTARSTQTKLLRWRQEMNSETRSYFDQEFEKEFRALGYPLSDE
jgi:hypothetical protein